MGRSKTGLGGARRDGKTLKRSRTCPKTLEEVRDRSQNLGEVRDGSWDPRGGLGPVERHSGRSRTGRRNLG